MGKSILIIKLDAAGDVLRTTCILPGLKKIDADIDNVTWITNTGNQPLLKYNKFITHLLSSSQADAALSKHFDYAVNFDEDLEACDLLTMATADKKFGFINDNGKYKPVNDLSHYAYKMSHDDDLKFRENKKTYQQIIYEMCGIEWSGEFYSFDYGQEKGNYIALNSEVGDKWPTKRWQNWDKLERLLKAERIHYEKQQNFDNIESYFEWIAQSQMVITSDSLGMHLAIAMKKPTIALFGPTSHVEIEDYGIAQKIYDYTLDCLVCYKSKCPFNHECMIMIDEKEVMKRIMREIDG